MRMKCGPCRAPGPRARRSVHAAGRGRGQPSVCARRARVKTRRRRTAAGDRGVVRVVDVVMRSSAVGRGLAAASWRRGSASQARVPMPSLFTPVGNGQAMPAAQRPAWVKLQARRSCVRGSIGVASSFGDSQFTGLRSGVAFAEPPMRVPIPAVVPHNSIPASAPAAPRRPSACPDGSMWHLMHSAARASPLAQVKPPQQMLSR